MLGTVDNAPTLPHLGATLTPHQAATLLEAGAAGPESAETWARALRGEPANRFREVMPSAIPWRDRQQSSATAHALVRENANDSEAADVFAYEANYWHQRALGLAELRPPAPIVITMPYK